MFGDRSTENDDSKDPFRIVIVRDMWLTGFDAPCLHTMYAGKPMRGHGLMQAIAIMLEKYEVACDILHGFDWSLWKTGSGTQKLSLIPAAQEHVLEQEDGKKRFIQVVMELSRAFALCAASDEATAIRDDVSFLQTVQAALNKQTTGGRKSPEDLFSDKLKQTLNAYHNRAIATHEVIKELIRLAKEMEAAQKRGEELGLTDDEITFYDALATNESAITVMGDDKLKVIAAELIKMVRKSVTIDWTLRETARAKIRVIVKRILNKWGYPPDLQEEAVKTVLQQAELLCADWSDTAI